MCRFYVGRATGYFRSKRQPVILNFNVHSVNYGDDDHGGFVDDCCGGNDTRVVGLLAIDGIGEARFGEPASRVIPQLISIFGPAVDDSFDSCGRRIVHLVGILAKFQDPREPTRRLADPPFGSYEFLKSELSPENSAAQLRTELGIGIGSTRTEPEQKYPNALNNRDLYVIRSDRGIVQLMVGADDRITAHVAQAPTIIGCGD